MLYTIKVWYLAITMPSDNELKLLGSAFLCYFPVWAGDTVLKIPLLVYIQEVFSVLLLLMYIAC